MSGLPPTSEYSSRGGISVVLVVFCVLGFLLAVGAEATYLRLSDSVATNATKRTEGFDPTPISDLIQPAPKFSPEQVVEIQLAGLAKSDLSTGIQQCFAFASPSNRQTTGPLPRFAAMVSRAPYAVLMDHQLALVGTPIIEGESASIVVTLVDDHDAIHVFQFLLSKQHEDTVKDCWMTDAVFPLDQVPEGRAGNPATAGTPRADLRTAMIDTCSDPCESAHG